MRDQIILTSRVENSGIPTPKNPGIDISKPHITGVLGSMAHLWLSQAKLFGLGFL